MLMLRGGPRQHRGHGLVKIDGAPEYQPRHPEWYHTMNDDDEPRTARLTGLVVPTQLDRLSVDEMTALRQRLSLEIARLDAEVTRRAEVRRAADALFKRSG